VWLDRTATSLAPLPISSFVGKQFHSFYEHKQNVNVSVTRFVDYELNILFNIDMHSQTNIIDALGGPKKVAEMLGLSREPGAIQRVGNWKRRGIPAQVLIDNPAFLRKVRAVTRETRKQAVAYFEPAHA
jgi:hypothetical protein